MTQVTRVVWDLSSDSGGDRQPWQEVTMVIELVLFAAATLTNTIALAPEAPPSPRIEIRSECPELDCDWQPGRWTWSEDGWLWLDGRWIETPSTNAKWQAGQWRRSKEGWRWNQGAWS